MNLYEREQYARSRILEAATLLGRQQRVDVPRELSTVSGDRQTRRVVHLEAVAGFVERLVLENVQTGLSEKLGAVGYTSVAVLRQTADEDLLALEGVGQAAVGKLKKALALPADDPEVPPAIEIDEDPAADDEPVAPDGEVEDGDGPQG